MSCSLFGPQILLVRTSPLLLWEQPGWFTVEFCSNPTCDYTLTSQDTQSHRTEKTSSLYNEKSCSYLSKSFKTSRVLKYRIYSYQRLSFDLDWLYERKSLQFRFCKFFSCDIMTRHFESQLKITSQETTTNWCCCLCEQNAQNNMEIVRKYPFTCPWWFVYGDSFRPEV